MMLIRNALAQSQIIQQNYNILLLPMHTQLILVVLELQNKIMLKF